MATGVFDRASAPRKVPGALLLLGLAAMAGLIVFVFAVTLRAALVT